MTCRVQSFVFWNVTCDTPKNMGEKNEKQIIWPSVKTDYTSRKIFTFFQTFFLWTVDCDPFSTFPVKLNHLHTPLCYVELLCFPYVSLAYILTKTRWLLKYCRQKYCCPADPLVEVPHFLEWSFGHHTWCHGFRAVPAYLMQLW